MQNQNSLLVVAKQPVPGQTKTRLCPPLSFGQAASLYSCFLHDTLDKMRRVPGVERIIGYLPEGALEEFQRLAPDMRLICQRGDNLGVRLNQLLTEVLTNGSSKAVVINSDSPTLPTRYITLAFEQLSKAEVVLGPTEDGGYYLIGLGQPQPNLLLQVQMSTDHVLADTLALAAASGLTVSLLPAWYDVDTVDDLTKLAGEMSEMEPDQSSPATWNWLQQAGWIKSPY